MSLALVLLGGLATAVGLVAGPAPAAHAATDHRVAMMNLHYGKRNSDVRAYQRALRRYAPRAGVVANRFNPSGATGYYGHETQAFTRAIYLGIARKTGNRSWARGDLRTPGPGLVARIGLTVVRTPYGMRHTGGGTKLITVEGARLGSTTGIVRLWRKTGHGWVIDHGYKARFGANGLTPGKTRRQNTYTTPTGRYPIPFAFGKASNPGTSLKWRHVTPTAWWCEDVRSGSYNRWVDPKPADCRASESEHLTTYATYSYAAVIGFNYAHPVKGRGAGIFLHVNGRGLTAGCVSIPKAGMQTTLRWLTRSSHPHIAIGTSASLVNM